MKTECPLCGEGAITYNMKLKMALGKYLKRNGEAQCPSCSQLVALASNYWQVALLVAIIATSPISGSRRLGYRHDPESMGLCLLLLIINAIIYVFVKVKPAKDVARDSLRKRL